MDHDWTYSWCIKDLRLLKDISFIEFSFQGCIVREWEIEEFIRLLKHISPDRINADTLLIFPVIEFSPKHILALTGLNFIAFSTSYLNEQFAVHPWTEFNNISLKAVHIEHGEYISVEKLREQRQYFMGEIVAFIQITPLS